MRNLKKTLCLVLALVFVLGLCTVGAVNGTDFDDAEKINYTTAVKAMSGLGVLKGDDRDGDGNFSFRPTDKVTRAEAAKIIAYVVVGEEVEKWPARQVFDDVPADHWAAKYITYCQYNNIIAGYGNGKFGPNDPVTQAQLAKMLLSCCGYGAKGEFVGEGWDQNVAKVAFQTKVLKGILSADWDGPATREETALLAYNTMMEVRQVVLSKDTNDYAPAYINGSNNNDNGWTLANTTWDLDTAEGYVTKNKANSKTVLGTKIDGITTSAALFEDYYVTEEDENADILGHYVKITYRLEKINGVDTAVAYYVEDSCQDLPAAQVQSADAADRFYTTTNGNVATTATTTAAAATAAGNKGERMGTFVVNGEGKIIGKKSSSYFVAPLEINAVTKIASVNNGAVELTAIPEGAVATDMVTVYRCGDFYTAKACSKQEKVVISQSQLVDWSALFGFPYSFFSYNDGKVQLSKATNLAGISLTYVNQGNAMAVNNPNTAAPAVATPDLTVGWSYTLYFDAEGLVYAYSDGVQTSAAAATNFVWLACLYTGKDAYNNDAYYAQYVKEDGTVVDKAPITATEYNAAKYPAADANGLKAVCAVAVQSADQKVYNKFALSAPGDANYGYISKWTSATADPTTDFSNATYVYVGDDLGGKATASKLRPTTTDTPAKSTTTPAHDVEVFFTYTTVKVGTVNISRVKSVFFYEKTAVSAYADSSYVYVVNDDVKELRLDTATNTSVKYFNGYKDGDVMNDLRVKGEDVSANWGFNQYSVKDGVYTLNKVESKDNVNVYEIFVADQTLSSSAFAGNYIMNGKLYINTGTSTISIDLANVKFVRIANDTDSDMVDYYAKNITAPFTIDSAAAIQALLMRQVNPCVIKLDLIDVMNPYTFVHSAGGNVIYVTSVQY